MVKKVNFIAENIDMCFSATEATREADKFYHIN
jgi:hypothetical protein